MSPTTYFIMFANHFFSQKGEDEWKSWTFSFLPSMVEISASLPMVKELVTVLPGVLEVMTKSLPVCLISVTGLTSLASLMISSDNSVEQNICIILDTFDVLKTEAMVNEGKSSQVNSSSYPKPWGTPRSFPGSTPAMFHWSPFFLKSLGFSFTTAARGWDSCVRRNTTWGTSTSTHTLLYLQAGSSAPCLMSNKVPEANHCCLNNRKFTYFCLAKPQHPLTGVKRSLKWIC